jgi:hypothetical protein
MKRGGPAKGPPLFFRTSGATAALHSLCWTGLMPPALLVVAMGADEPTARTAMSAMMMDSWVSIFFSFEL